MTEEFEFGLSHRGLVYIKAVNVSDLPKRVQKAAGDKDTLYAVHKDDGERLALVSERPLAFALARQHDMTPVTVH